MGLFDNIKEQHDLRRSFVAEDAFAEPALELGKQMGEINETWASLRSDPDGGYIPSSFLHDGYVHRKKALRTGLVWVDNMLGGGLYPGLNVLNAEPAAGKSLFAIQVSVNVALKGGRVIYFTSELPANQVVMRSLVYLSTQYPELKPFSLNDVRENAQKLRECESKLREQAESLGKGEGEIDSYSWEHLLEGDLAKDNVARAFHVFEDLCQGFMVREVDGIDDILDVLDKLSIGDENPPSLVVVDYLQRLRPPGNMDSRTDEKALLDETVKQLTDYGNIVQVPVLCISSMNRVSMNTGMTSMHVSSGTGQIEFDATTSIVMVNAKRKALDENGKRLKDDLGNDVIEQVEEKGPKPSEDRAGELDEDGHVKMMPVVKWYVAKCREYPYDSNNPDTMLRDGAHSRFIKKNEETGSWKWKYE